MRHIVIMLAEDEQFDFKGLANCIEATPELLNMRSCEKITKGTISLSQACTK